MWSTYPLHKLILRTYMTFGGEIKRMEITLYSCILNANE
jgi:hypothetical protein